MEIANLEKSPAGLLTAGIIAPVDLLSKCNLVYNQSALMANSLGENYRQRPPIVWGKITTRDKNNYTYIITTGMYNHHHTINTLQLVAFH